MTGGVNLGNGPSVVGGWIWGKGTGEGEGVQVFARQCPFTPVLSGVAQVAVQAAPGTSEHFYQVSLSFSYGGYTRMAGTECVHSASCCSGWEVVLVVSNGTGPEMSLLG